MEGRALSRPQVAMGFEKDDTAVVPPEDASVGRTVSHAQRAKDDTAVVPPGRKRPVHLPVRERHNRPVIVFLTVCTKDRKRILATEAARGVLVSSWRAAQSWLVGRYVILPDHLHLFCAPTDITAQPIAQWVRYWKSSAARDWPQPEDAPVWQRDFWDTQLRRTENYDQKWQYVLENPVRAGLVPRAEDWPFQGELNILRW
jgi:REP element-mobilizing transposase RayT